MMYWNGSQEREMADMTDAPGDIVEVRTATGSGLTGGVTSGVADISIVNDNSSLEISGNTLRVKDGGITSAKMNAGSVTSAKLADSSVTSAKIVDGTIVSADVANVSIGKIVNAPTEYFTYAPAGTDCTDGYVLKWTVNDRWECAADLNTNLLTSVFGRSGAVVAVAGDYTAAQITNTAAGNIAANTAQAAINELDTEKVAKSGDAMTGNLTMNAQNSIRFADADSSNHVSLRAPAAITSNFVLTLPADVGIPGQVLTTTSGGSLIWSTPAVGDITNVITNSGSALTGGSASNDVTLAVVTDGTTIGITSNALHVIDSSISNSKLANSSVTTTKLADNSVTSAKIIDGSIVNADINASAAIAWSKIDKTGASATDIGAVPTNRSIATGSGLTGGGDLTANRTIAVANNGITSTHIDDGTIADVDIGSVSVSKITSPASAYFSYMPGGAQCADGHTLKWTASDRWECSADIGVLDHGALTGLNDDDHNQYVMLGGRSSGQVIRGGTSAGDDLTLDSTVSATKGTVFIQPTGGSVVIGATSATGSKLQVKGDIVSAAYTYGAGSDADFSYSNNIIFPSTLPSTSSITLSNMKTGGSYTILIKNTAVRNYTFSGCGSYSYKPSDPATTPTSGETIFTIMYMGTKCYIAWSTGW